MKAVTRIVSMPKILLLCLLLLPLSPSSADSPRFQVLSNKIVTTIQGFDGKAITWRNSKIAKGVVLTIKAKIPEDMQLWCVDFVLAYHHGGREDRGRCRGIATVTSSPDDEGQWVVGDVYAKVKARAGVRYFKILFPLENDVKRFKLHYSSEVTGNIRANR